MKSANQTPQPELAVATTQPMEVTQPEPPAIDLVGVNINALLEKAVTAESGVAILERLQVMRREMRSERAKEEFDKALAAFQAECPVLKKEKFGAKNAYKYCPLDAMIPQIQPILLRHKFSFTISTKIENNLVESIVTLKHNAGHFETSSVAVPVDSRNPMMNEQQRFGGAITFGKRYALCNALGIMTGDEDKDGELSKQRPAGPATAQPAPSQPAAASPKTEKELQTELWNLLKAHDSTLTASGAWQEAKEFLLNHEVLKPGEKITALPVPRLVEIIAATKKLLGGE